MKTKLRIAAIAAFFLGTGMILGTGSYGTAIGSSDKSLYTFYPQERGMIRNHFYSYDDGYFYTSRIRRFHRPVVGVTMNYYDPIYTDIYWYDPAPFWGANVYFGLPYWYYTPFYSTIVYQTPVYYWDDFYYPYYGGVSFSINIGFPSWGFRNRYWYGTGYNGYWGGSYYVTRNYYRAYHAPRTVFYTPYYYSNRDRYYSYKTYTRGPVEYRNTEGSTRRGTVTNVSTNKPDRPATATGQRRTTNAGTITPPRSNRSDNANNPGRGRQNDNEPTRTRTGWDNDHPAVNHPDNKPNKDNTPTRTRTGWQANPGNRGGNSGNTPAVERGNIPSNRGSQGDKSVGNTGKDVNNPTSGENNSKGVRPSTHQERTTARQSARSNRHEGSRTSRSSKSSKSSSSKSSGEKSKRSESKSSSGTRRR